MLRYCECGARLYDGHQKRCRPCAKAWHKVQMMQWYYENVPVARRNRRRG